MFPLISLMKKNDTNQNFYENEIKTLEYIQGAIISKYLRYKTIFVNAKGTYFVRYIKYLCI